MIESSCIPFASRAGQFSDWQQNSDKPVLNCPIVLLHGWGCDSRIWTSLIPFLNSYADLILIDIEYSDNNSDDCCNAIGDKLPDNCVLLGWSLGGMLAARVATMYPAKVSALISLASNVSFVANSTWPDAMGADIFAQFLDEFAANAKKTLTRFALLQVKGDSDSRCQLAYLKQCLVNNTYLEAGLHYLREMNNQDVVFNKIICPSIYVFGENDALVPVSAACELEKVLRQYSVKADQSVVIIRDKAHVLPYVNEDSELLLVLNDFFTQQRNK